MTASRTPLAERTVRVDRDRARVFFKNGVRVGATRAIGSWCSVWGREDDGSTVATVDIETLHRTRWGAVARALKAVSLE